MTNSTEQAELRAKVIGTVCFKLGVTGHQEQFERIETLIEAETLNARIEELIVLANHLLGDLYDNNDTSLEDNRLIREKIYKRVATLQSQRKDKDE